MPKLEKDDKIKDLTIKSCRLKNARLSQDLGRQFGRIHEGSYRLTQTHLSFLHPSFKWQCHASFSSSLPNSVHQRMPRPLKAFPPSPTRFTSWLPLKSVSHGRAALLSSALVYGLPSLDGWPNRSIFRRTKSRCSLSL